MRGVYRAQSHPAASLYFRLVQSSIDVLIDIKVGAWLCCQISVWPDLYTLTDLHIAVIP